MVFLCVYHNPLKHCWIFRLKKVEVSWLTLAHYAFPSIYFLPTDWWLPPGSLFSIFWGEDEESKITVVCNMRTIQKSFFLMLTVFATVLAYIKAMHISYSEPFSSTCCEECELFSVHAYGQQLAFFICEVAGLFKYLINHTNYKPDRPSWMKSTRSPPLFQNMLQTYSSGGSAVKI